MVAGIGYYTSYESANFQIQHTTCKVHVASHSCNTNWPGDGGTGQYDLSSSTIQCSVDDAKTMASAQLVLVPKRPWRKIVFPGDWISIYFATNTTYPEGFGIVGWPHKKNDVDRVFLGIIDAVRESVSVNESGVHSVRITISCSGFVSVFSNTQIYYNEMLGPNSLFGAMLPGLATLSKNIPLMGTPATIPRAIALAYLGFGGQCLLPKSYPTRLGDDTLRKIRLQQALARMYAIENDLGFLKTRLQVTPKERPKNLVQLLQEKYSTMLSSRAPTTLMDLFTYVEDLFVDGRVQNAPTHDLTGSVWKLMEENSNPSMNECFISLLPSTMYNAQYSTDEWGYSPAYVPCLVIRERPFAWFNSTFEVSSRTKGKTRQIRFGNVFFSNRSNPVFPEILQNTSGTVDYTDYRFVDRLRIRPQDIRNETIGTSRNDLRNFWMISQASVPLIQQRFTLLQDGLVPMFVAGSLERFGLSMDEITTKFMFTGGPQRGATAAFDFLVRCLLAQDIWYQHAPYYLAGTMEIAPIPKVRAGMMLDIGEPRNESYYIESVSQNWSHPGVLATSLTLTRGQPSGYSDPKKRFYYAAPDSVRVFSNDSRGIPQETIRSELPETDQPLRHQKGVDVDSQGALAALLGVSGITEETLIGAAQAQAARDNRSVFDVLRENTAIDPTKIAAVERKAKPRWVPFGIKLKEDRTHAGAPPWTEQIELRDEMWDAVRRLRTTSNLPED